MLSPKTIAKIGLAGALVAGVALVGCAGADNGSVDTAGDTTVSTSDTTSEGVLEPETDEPTYADPVVTDWKDAADGAEAAKSAGLEGGFEVPESLTAHEIEFSAPTFAYTAGIAKATYDQPASMVEVRKGSGPAGTVTADDGVGFDPSKSFATSWEVKIGEQDVTCYGDKEGEILYANWYSKADPEQDGESDAFSVRPQGLGGEDIPMTEAELQEVVAAVK